MASKETGDALELNQSELKASVESVIVENDPKSPPVSFRTRSGKSKIPQIVQNKQNKESATEVKPVKSDEPIMIESDEKIKSEQNDNLENRTEIEHFEKSESEQEEESEADDVTQLTNKELKTKLQDLGIATGPIVDSTRKIYEKKLEKLIAKGSDVAYSTDEDGEPEEPVQEENEETDDQMAEPVRRSNRTRKTESKSVVEDKFSDDEDDLPVVKNTSSRRRSARIQKSKNKTPEPEVETIEEEQQEETVEEEPVAEVKTEEVVVEAVKEPNCVSKLYTALCNNFHTILFFVLLFVAGYLVYQERSAICALAGTVSTNVVDAYTKFYYSMLPDIETIPEDATPKAEL